MLAYLPSYGVLVCRQHQHAVYSSACNSTTTSRTWMRQHISKQHSVHVSRWSIPSATSYKTHAAQLWKPVKVQTFFTEKR
jgi:hypothetical protein